MFNKKTIYIFTIISLLFLIFNFIEKVNAEGEMGGTVPAPPSNLTVIDKSTSLLRWQWSEPADATFYQIYDGETGDKLSFYNITANWWTINNLNPNTYRSIKVKACNSVGCSDFSSTVGAYTYANVPTNLSKGDYDDSNRTMRWQWNKNGNPDGTEYYIDLLRTDNYNGVGGYYVVKTGVTTADNYTFLLPGCKTWYKARVRAMNGDNVFTDYETNSDEEATSVGVCVSSPPTDVTLSDESTSYDNLKIKISWRETETDMGNPVEFEITRYKGIYKQGVKDKTFTLSYDNVIKDERINEYAYSWIDNTVSNNVSYYYYVKSRYDESIVGGIFWGSSAISDPPAVYTFPDKATNLSCSTTTNSITWSWEAGNGGSGDSDTPGFKVWTTSAQGTDNYNNGDRTNNTSWAETGLYSNTAYTLHVETINGDESKTTEATLTCTTGEEGGPVGPTGTCSSESDLCKAEQVDGTWYYCTNVGGTYTWRTSTDCDDGNSCTYGDQCTFIVGDQGTCTGSLYCSGSDTSCGCTSCTNCNNNDNWYNTGNTQWVTDPNNECQEKEQDQWEYRDYYCSDYSCSYSITDTKWVDTGETRNKDDGTSCSGGDCNVCCSGSCTSPVCCVDTDCDDSNPGTTDTCLNAGTCNAECSNIQGQWPDLIIQDISWTPSGTVSSGDDVDFTITIKNQGNAAAGSSVVKYYIDGVYADQDSVTGIPQGSTNTRSFNWTATCGHSHEIKAVADANNSVAESNEGNNERRETIYISNCSPNAPTLSGPTSGQPSQSYDFTAMATDPDGDNVKYNFDWGDGSSDTTGYVSSDTSQTKSHSWTQEGNYSVCVVAGDEDEWSSPTCQTINISEGNPSGGELTADFSYCLQNETTSTVEFTDQSSGSSGTINSWLWDFGDNQTSDIQDPEHTYSANGWLSPFNDNFNDGDYDGWRIKKLRSDYCNWTVENNSVKEKSNKCLSLLLSPYYSSASNYVVKAKIKNHGTMNNAIGIVFGYLSENYFHMFVWEDPINDYGRTKRMLIDYKKGQEYILAQDSGITMDDNTWYDIEIEVNDGQVKAKVNGQTILTSSGVRELNESGFYSYDNDNGVYYDDFIIQEEGNGTVYSVKLSVGDSQGASASTTKTIDLTSMDTCPTNNAPEVQDISPVAKGDYCTTPAHTFIWTYTDEDEDTESKFQFQVDDNSDFSSPEIDREYTDLSYSSGEQNSQTVMVMVNPTSDALSYNSTYYWRVKVWDSQGADSGWVYGSSFSTEKHLYPAVSFDWGPQYPSVKETVNFTDSSEVYNSSKSAWHWTFEGGTPSSSIQQNPQATFDSNGRKTITLQITDSDGYSCSLSKDLMIGLSMPMWKEIAPK